MTTVNVRYMVDDVDAAITFYTQQVGGGRRGGTGRSVDRLGG
jgi:hypothetical protein